jgi:hypothetical protein
MARPGSVNIFGSAPLLLCYAKLLCILRPIAAKLRIINRRSIKNSSVSRIIGSRPLPNHHCSRSGCINIANTTLNVKEEGNFNIKEKSGAGFSFATDFQEGSQNNSYKDKEDFLQLFTGFADAEGSFIISTPKETKEIHFCFKITLHIDDFDVLYLIKNILAIGIVATVRSLPSISLNKVILMNLMLLPLTI